MNRETIPRRSFLLLVGAGIAGLLSGRGARAKSRKTLLTFYVAGVQFHEREIREVTGDRVEIREELFRGETCYGVYGKSDSKIGYVPRKLVHVLRAGRRGVAYLSRLVPHTVPWRRYQVCVELFEEISGNERRKRWH